MTVRARSKRTLLWFRGKDLRLSDHLALRSALEADELVCVFVLDPFFFAPVRARELPHRMSFLLDAITALARALEQRGSRLILVEGKSIDVVPQIARRWGVDRVVAQRWSEPFARVRDERIARALEVPFDLFDGETLAPPGRLRNAEGRPYAVFSAFARTHRTTIAIEAPLPAPRTIAAPPAGLTFATVQLPTLADLGITPNPLLPPAGEGAGERRLARFIEQHGHGYDTLRDRLDLDATSRLSADLHFGTLSPRTVWSSAERALARSHPAAWSRFSDELLWREFAHAVLWDDPALLERPHRAKFASFPSQDDPQGWQAWCTGTTGYPVVDAAARQLCSEGFVHNRARMIAASFLCKHLLIDHRRGEAWYLKYLVDGDWAQNNFGWQWTTGCGFDAAPYFRVFNPIEQGKRFDPSGAYVRKWLPELARLPDEWLHEPWRAPAAVLRAAGVELGATYPRPIVDHHEARARYLATVAHIG
jgi:deoxyribodipyrimidine photo-lyase